MGRMKTIIRRLSCARGTGEFRPRRSLQVFSTVTTIGTILTWPLGRARPDFERAFMRFVSDRRSRMGRRKFGSKLRKGVPDGS